MLKCKFTKVESYIVAWTEEVFQLSVKIQGPEALRRPAGLLSECLQAFG